MSGRVEAPVAGDGQVVVDRADLKIALHQSGHSSGCHSWDGAECDCYLSHLRAAVSTEGEESK